MACRKMVSEIPGPFFPYKMQNFISLWLINTSTMKKSLEKSICVLLAVFTVLSCVDSRNREMARLISERDSLLAITTEQDSIQVELDNYMQVIASTIDSIKTQENILTLTRDENGKPLSKRQIRENLTTLEQIISRQRDRIEELEAQLIHNGKDSTSYYRQLVLFLNEQLEVKNRQIEALKNELSRKDRHIAALDSQVSVLKQDVLDLEEQNRDQNETIQNQTAALQAQNDQLNRGHILVASKTKLQNLEVIGKGLVSQKKINYANLDDSIFTTVDLRSVQEIPLESKKPKILTAHPADSYRIEKVDKNNSILIISDPGRFWSLTVYLIIQL